MLRTLVLYTGILLVLIYVPQPVLASILSGSLPEIAFLKRYDLVNADRAYLQNEHHILKRSLYNMPREDQHIKWSFHALNKDFRVHLQPNHRVFSPNAIVETSDGNSVDFDRHQVFTGHLIGKSGSRVNGVIRNDGRFQGRLFDGTEEFFIERAEKLLPKSGLSHKLISDLLVVYRASDVVTDPYTNRTSCKSDLLSQHMNDISHGIQISGDEELMMSSNSLNHYLLDEQHAPLVSRVRRAINPTKTMCELYVQADFLFYEKLGSSVDTVIEELTAHIDAVNTIYQDIDFDGDGHGDQITFVVKKLKVWTDETASDYPFPGNYDVQNFLEILSTQENFDDFCLAYTFTHRDFNDGTLGLAWTAAINAAGGVCMKNGRYNGQRMSLNTGIVTTLNFQSSVPFAISHITFAHELAHNLGSPHDEIDTTCAPGDSNGGNYIMFPKATEGDKENNDKFSSCSITSMNIIMNDRARHDESSACFKVFSNSTCGNKIVEEDEECDCGWEDGCDETCCYPQKSSYDVLTYFPCTRTPGSICSPSAGGCCNGDCQVRQAAETFECRTESSCKRSAVCDGVSAAECPLSEHKQNGTNCAVGMVCYEGDCSESICRAFGYETCQCNPDAENDWSDPKLCQLCCEFDGLCVPATTIGGITGNVSESAGMPCYNYQGYCDVFSKCRQLDPVGPINGLKNLLFSVEGQASITEWSKSNWYIIASAGLGFVILLAVALKFGSKHEPVIPPGEEEPKSSAKSRSKSQNKVQPTKIEETNA